MCGLEVDLSSQDLILLLLSRKHFKYYLANIANAEFYSCPYFYLQFCTKMPVKIKTSELEGRDCTPSIKAFYYAFKAG